ncbi:MAG: Trk system potassium transporter TrkA [Oscillospiraceae bacterium]|nr:Trk system potassium transporter TrkA [Oscillospiraceae bacterium]
MNIIVVGCGKVGTTLVKELAAEKHNIVIVDIDAEKLDEVGNTLDVMCVEGRGEDVEVLIEADVSNCDILIAMMQSDELNLLTCLLAKKLGAKNTIARVRNPIYSNAINLIKDDLGLSMYINPERAAAGEISRLLRFPNAMQVETFAKGRVEIMKYEIPEGSVLSELKICQLRPKLKTTVFVCAVERAGEVFVPDGNFILRSGDIISFVAPIREANEFLKKVGSVSAKIKDVIILGGGKLTYYLTERLLDSGYRVKIIEINKKRCEELSELLPEAMIINGDATNNNLLHEEHIENADAVLSLTGVDEQNVLMSIYASKQAPEAKVVTKIKHFDFDDILRGMPIGSIVYPKYITADYVLRYVRVMQNSWESNMESLHRIVDDRVEALEFRIRQHNALVGITFQQLNIKKGTLVACITRNGKTFTPGGKDSIQVGDTVIIVTIQKGISKLEQILDGEAVEG